MPGVKVDEYFGDDIKDKKLISRLQEYIFYQDPIQYNGNLRYKGYPLQTMIGMSYSIFKKTDIIYMVLIDQSIFNLLQDIWQYKQTK
jgi:hypothetical protein